MCYGCSRARPHSPKLPGLPARSDLAGTIAWEDLSLQQEAATQPHATPLLHGPGATRSCLSLISREGPGLLAWPRRGCISFQRANEPQLLRGEKGHEQAREEWDPPQGAGRGDHGCPLPRAGSPGCPLTAILKAQGCSHQNTCRGVGAVPLLAALPQGRRRRQGLPSSVARMPQPALCWPTVCIKPAGSPLLFR